MSARHCFTSTTPPPRRARIARTAAVLLTAAACVAIVGCASRGTVKKTIFNSTSEIDRIAALAEDPKPEIHSAAWSAAPVTAKSIREGQPIEYTDVSVSDVLQIAMQNSQVLRDLGGTLLRTPDAVRTRYAPGLQQTDPRFGPAAALSAFDAQWRSSANFSHNDRIYNNSFFAGGVNSFLQDYHDYKTELSKRTAIGSQMILRGASDMDQNNAPGNIFPSAWNTFVEAEVRQPLVPVQHWH